MRRKGLIILALMVIGIVALANAARHTFSQQPGFRSTQINLEDSYTLYGPVPEDLVVVAETVDLHVVPVHVEVEVTEFGAPLMV